MKPILPPWQSLLDIGVRVALAIVVGWVAQRLIFLLIGRIETWVVKSGDGGAYARHRARTLVGIFRNMTTVLIVVVVVSFIIGVMGWDIRPLLAGAGLISVVVGFGAQTLVRDIISGIFIIAEDQFAVGDVVEVNGQPATVEGLSVRSSTLRDFQGRLYFVPNGEMKVVVNYSRGWHRLAVDVPIALDEDVERALATCERVAAAMNNDAAWRARLLDPVEVFGIENLTGAEMQVRMVVRSRPGPDSAEAARELRRRVLAALAQAGVRLAVPREITIQPLAGSPAPASLATERS
ncbi:MAG: mechanosensitive ion channel family protein [Candidatus Eisenbacteria bacterium]|uniref:Mechanosensitive ion channel family protein n=1 Tax=Eiseniibacteriota bacterium TaxID=2212470 RepID=A0A9D6QM29_UNCEI|nr:mechanosensitive ion channel family protein [Candidatus Eisenbacteria bacterium]